LIVVEHDLPLILSISDRVYCLEAGRVIAEGLPSTVRDDPRVVASYLGTDDRAIQRSNAGPDRTALRGCSHANCRISLQLLANFLAVATVEFSVSSVIL